MYCFLFCFVLFLFLLLLLFLFLFLFLFCFVLFSLMRGPVNDILVIGGTVLEVLAPVSPCHSLVQKFMASVCNIF